MENEIIGKFKKYCRPQIADVLRAIRLDKVYEKAKGDYIYYTDENGAEIKVTDFLGGYGANLFGHNHPDLVAKAQSILGNDTPFNSQASIRGNAALLCEKLDSMLFERTQNHFVTTLASTGTEATEAAIKHAELSHQNRIGAMLEDLRKKLVILKKQYVDGILNISPDFIPSIESTLGARYNNDFSSLLGSIYEYNCKAFSRAPYFLSLRRAFHGKTTGSVQLTYNEDYRKAFSRIAIEVLFIEPGYSEELDNAIDKTVISYYWPEVNSQGNIYLAEKKYVNVTAMFIEPLQGEGGIHVIQPEFLAYCREICTKHNIPLIFDEIQCGMGRAGTFLFSEHSGVIADYYLLSKSLGGGLSKIAAMMVKDTLYVNEFGLIHSSTFCEDEYSSGIALEALRLLQDDPDILVNCREKGDFLKSGLLKLKDEFPDVIKDVRGVGLMLGIELNSLSNFKSNALSMLSDQGLLSYTIAGYMLNEHCIRIAPTMSQNATIRLEPSAFISDAECERLLKAFHRVCEIIHKQNVYELTKYIAGLATPGSTHEIKDYHQEFIPYIKPKNARKVAFIVHIIQPQHLSLFDEGFTPFSREQCVEYIDRLYKIVDPWLFQRITVKSATGELVNLNVIGLFIDSMLIAKHMMSFDIKPIHDKLEKCVEVAVADGCQAIGFGGFTSIVTNNCESIITDSIAVTTGNALTVAMGLEAMYIAAGKEKIDLSKSCFAGIGATGNICSIYSEIIAEKVPRIILIGRPGKTDRLKSVASAIYSAAFTQILNYISHLPGKIGSEPSEALQGVAEVIYETNSVRNILNSYTKIDSIGNYLFDSLGSELGDKTPVVITSDYSCLKEANLIVSASNTPQPVIFPEMLGEGPIIINDIAVPDDVDESVRQRRNDVTVFSGGLVKTPFNPDFIINGMPVEPGLMYACMGETLLLGLTDVSSHYSYGRINRIQVKKIMKIANLHGFTMGMFKTERSF